uniref:Uncharacterized protein n=1 Tax=Neolamprologus brichardi TaxID=32507 RepID=A0A3Q4IBF7_NEOBR
VGYMISTSVSGTIKLCSWNVQGLQKPTKRLATHLQDKDNIKLKRGWVGQVFATSYSSFIRGVAILVSKKLAFQCLNCVKNDHGRYIIVKGTLLGKEVTFMNLSTCSSASKKTFFRHFACLMRAFEHVCVPCQRCRFH